MKSDLIDAYIFWVGRPFFVLECLTGKRGFGVYFASAKPTALVIGILLLINWLIINGDREMLLRVRTRVRKSTPKIKLTGRAGMIYSDAGRTMKIDSEMLACGEYDLVIYERSMQSGNRPMMMNRLRLMMFPESKVTSTSYLQRYRIEWQS